MKKHILPAFLSALVVVFAACSGEIAFSISTTIPGAGFTYQGEEYTTPAEITIPKGNPVVINLHQPGFEYRKVTIDPKQDDREIEVTLLPEVGVLRVSARPSGAVIDYHDRTFRNGEDIYLKYEDPVVLSVRAEGYETEELVVSREELRDRLYVVLESRAAGDFEDGVRAAVAAGDASALKELVAPYSRNVLIRFENSPESDFNQLYYRLHSITASYYEQEDWDSLIFLLEHGVRGYVEEEVSSGHSLLDKAIEADDIQLLKRLIDAGADIDADWNMGLVTSDLSKCIRSNSLEALRFLLDTGLDPNSPVVSSGKIEYEVHTEYPIFTAVRMDNEAALVILIEYGASMDTIQIHEVMLDDGIQRVSETIEEKDGSLMILMTEEFGSDL